MKRLKFTGLFLLIAFFTLYNSPEAGKKPPPPEMSIVLEDGREVTLHPDSTWEFVQFSFLQEDFDDIYMDLDDGRILCLKNDNTWLFVKKKPPKKKLEFKEVPSVNAKTTATASTVDQAVQAARKKVFDRAAQRLYKYAKKSKMTTKYLVACIKDEVGEEGAEISYKKVKAWTATARLDLTKVQVAKILDCVIVQVDAGTGTKADTSKSAEKKKSVPGDSVQKK
jgi:hypothetical protein